MTRKLFELCGTDSKRVFSPYCWRARMALAHKGLDHETIPWRFTEKDAIRPHKSEKVPVLLDGDKKPLARPRYMDMLTTTHDSAGEPLRIVTSLLPGSFGVDPARVKLAA